MAKKKINKKKLIIILASIVLIIGIIIYITLINKETINHIFKYKDKLTIEAGSKIPTMNDYLYHNTTEEKEIVWDNIEIEEKKYINLEHIKENLTMTTKKDMLH